MGLFDKLSETKQESVANIDFPVFVGEYPFDRTIIESKIVISSKSYKNTEIAIKKLVESAEQAGFDAITHLTFKPQGLYNGSSLGEQVYGNMVKFAKS